MNVSVSNVYIGVFLHMCMLYYKNQTKLMAYANKEPNALATEVWTLKGLDNAEHWSGLLAHLCLHNIQHSVF